jgi:hypothetical protein
LKGVECARAEIDGSLLRDEAGAFDPELVRSIWQWRTKEALTIH